MTADDCKWSFDEQLQSDPGRCPEILQQLLEALEQFHWGPDDRFAIRMAFEEALINAIKHGNQSNTEKPVHVVICFCEEKFYAKITDQGCGFNPDDVTDPTADENVDKPCGRGVMLMKNFVDSVSYNDAGNAVEITKKNTGK